MLNERLSKVQLEGWLVCHRLISRGRRSHTAQNLLQRRRAPLPLNWVALNWVAGGPTTLQQHLVPHAFHKLEVNPEILEVWSRFKSQSCCLSE